MAAQPKLQVKRAKMRLAHGVREDEIALDYCTKAALNKIVVGNHVRNVCTGLLQNLWYRPKKGQRFNTAEADRVVRFFETFKLTQGRFEGVPFKLQQWQKFVIRTVFGWQIQDEIDGTWIRLFQELYTEAGKGCGKSVISGIIANYMLLADRESRPQVFITAKDLRQAGIAMGFAANMLIANKGLYPKYAYIKGNLDSPKAIVFKGAGDLKAGFMRRVPKLSRGFGMSGFLPSCVLVDEVVEIVDHSTIDLLVGGVKHRRQPLVVYTTNAGSGVETPSYKLHQRAIAVANGTINDESDDRLLPLIYAVDDDDDPLNDPKCWPKSGPSLPVIPGVTYVKNKVSSAKRSPSRQAEVLRLDFTRWTEALDPWLDIEAWKACEVDKLSPYKERKEVPAYIGLDLATRSDLTAAVIVWDMGEHLEVRAKIWIPEEGLSEKADADNLPYVQWAEKGYITTVPGKIQDFDVVVGWLQKIMRTNFVRVLTYDTWMFQEITVQLDRRGVEYRPDPKDRAIYDSPPMLVSHPQNYKVPENKPADELWPAMPRSISHAEELILKGMVKVEYNPALRSAVLGAVPMMDASNNRRLAKNKSLTKIDAAVAMIMAMGVCKDIRDIDGVLDVAGILGRRRMIKQVRNWISRNPVNADDTGVPDGQRGRDFFAPSKLSYAQLQELGSLGFSGLDNVFGVSIAGVGGVVPFRHPVLLRCVTLISEVIAQLVTNGSMYIVDRNTGVRINPGSNTIAGRSMMLLTESPDGVQPAYQFIAGLATDLLTSSNMVVRIRRGPRNMPTAFYRQSMSDIETVRGSDGTFVFRSRDYGTKPGERQDIALANSIYSFWGSLTVHSDGINRLAVPLVTVLRPSIDVGIQGEKYVLEWFKGTAAQAPFIIVANGKVTPEIRERFQTYLRTLTGRDPVIFGKGVQVIPLQPRPQNSDIAELRRIQDVQIARVFGLPSPLVGTSDTAWGSTVTALSRIGWRFGIRQHIDRFIAGFSQRLLPPGQMFKFDHTDITKGSPEEMVPVVNAIMGSQNARAAGSREEARKFLDLPREIDGEVVEHPMYLQGNNVPNDVDMPEE